MDFQSYYNNYILQQAQYNNGTLNKENEYDSQNNLMQNTQFTRQTQFNGNMNKPNTLTMKDESTIKYVNASSLNKDVVGQTNNLLKNNQKQLNINTQRFFGQDLTNIQHVRSTTQNNIQNKAKITSNQNQTRYFGYSQICQKGRVQSQQIRSNKKSKTTIQQNIPKTNQIQIDYLNKENDLIQKINDKKVSREYENQLKMNLNSNKYKANSCKVSCDKENLTPVAQIKNNNYCGLSESEQNSNILQNRNIRSSIETENINEYQFKHLYKIKQFDYTFPKDNLQKDSIYQHARSIFDYLREIETKFVASGTMDYIQEEVNAKMRAIMIDWLIDVHLRFKLVPESLFLTINLIDRYTETQQIKKDRYQLLGATSLFIACKIEEIYPPEISDIIFICDNLYSKQDILDMEGDVITALDFNLTYTSPLRFLDRYCFLSESTEMQQFCAQYLIELALIEYNMVKYPSSIQASSALYLVNQIFELNQPWSEELSIQSQYDENQLQMCTQDIWCLLQKANEFQQQYFKQVTEIEQQEQIQMIQLQEQYNNIQRVKLNSSPINQQLAQQLEFEYDQRKKQIEAKIKEIKSSLLNNNKDQLAIIRKFSLPKFKEAANILYQIFDV